MKKPLYVLISDVHASVSTLALARAALIQAIDKAEDLRLPLLIAGDLNDTKAIIRGEVAIMLIEVLKYAESKGVSVIIMVGNHDKLNEKGAAHSLEFLRPYSRVVDEPQQLPSVRDAHEVYAIPYQTDVAAVSAALAEIPRGSTIIMHQGVRGAYMGEYVVDKSSIDPSELKHWRCISGHYHKHQTVGTLTYIGSPYTISFSEANDGPKGFQILYSDGTLEQIPTNLRKHVIIETSTQMLDEASDAGTDPFERPNPGDLVWLKVTGPYSALEALNKKQIGIHLLGTQNYKLDKIPTDEMKAKLKLETMTSDQILDKIIDDAEETASQKKYLKTLWREIMS